MIVTDIDNATEQVPATPGLQKALTFLRELGGKELADGRIDIDGNEVFALVQSYVTTPSSEDLMEGHRRYIDIQYIVEGKEIIGWAPTATVAVTQPYDGEKDVWLGKAPKNATIPVRLCAGQLAVLYPSDAHAPKLAAGSPTAVTKIVIKVAVGS